MIRDELFTREIRLANGSVVIRSSGACSLTLPSGEVRKIGDMVKNGNTIEYHCIRQERAHLLRVLNAYGINDTLWREIKPDIIVIKVTDIRKQYSVSYSDSVKIKQYKHFGGFEVQVFFPVEGMNEVSPDGHVVRFGTIKIQPTIQPKPKSVDSFSLFN
jgi:hypothetical protein